jgi:uncharacterized protein (UPF0303 family)
VTALGSNSSGGCVETSVSSGRPSRASATERTTSRIRCSAQFKLRRMLPSWLWAWLAGIVVTAERDGKIGVLVVKRPRQRDDDAIVMLRWADWVALHGASQGNHE